MATTSSENRGLVLSKRNTAISDMSRLAYTSGDLTIEAAIDAGLLTQNAVHMVGIATQSETRLDATRYPLRIVIGTAPAREMRKVTSFGYWRVVDAGYANIEFSRQTVVDDRMGANIRALFPNLDDDWWAFRKTRAGIPMSMTLDPALAAHMTTIRAAIALVSIPAEVVTACRDAMTAIIAACTTANRWPYFQAADNVFISSVPVGTTYAAVPPLSVNQVIGNEVALTIKANALALRARHPTASDGVINWAAHAIAMMFKLGIQETFEHEEFITVYVAPVATSATQFTVTSVDGPADYVPLAHVAVNAVIDRSDVRTSRELVEIGNLLVFTAGLMHYLFNHTTGGTIVTGTLSTILSGRSLIVNGMSKAEAEMVTTIMYEALHPVNKRAVANLMYANSRVYSHGKSAAARPYAQLSTDTFVQIRKNPYPAGSHKAFTLATGLKRLCQAGLDPFLPWASNMGECLGQCRSILRAGARAHVGAHYYTGVYPMSQTSSLDAYLPEVAAYIQIFHRNDSLAMSPHLSPEVAGRASATFTHLLKSLKSKDLSETSVTVVQEYLQASGKRMYELDLGNKETWGAAVEQNKDTLDQIETLFD